ncbi:DUF2567 domain-containing protein [Micromonospora sp. NPDC047730]|uniref:DUF2567 domain-containing protein n=1 Tax=Micromonospora sp. NPDC047730 TaxID=3364253 RepID=UPI00371CA196
MSADTPEPDRPGRRPDEPGAPAPAAPAERAAPAGDAPAGPYGAREVDQQVAWEAGPYAPPTAGAVSPYDGPGAFPYGDPGAAYGVGQPVPPAEPELPRRRAVRLAAGAGLALTVLGVPLGLLWAALAPDTPVLKVPDGAIYAEPQPEQPVAADGWFSLLGLGFGVLAALALWFVLRRVRGPVGLLAAVLGAFGAALVAWQVGRRIGLAGYQRLLETAPDGRAFSKPADLRAGGIDLIFGVLPVPHGNLLLPAFGAAVTYTLLAGWSRWPSLRPEPEPGAPGVSWESAGRPAPPAAPEPPAPGAAAPPHG